MRNVLRMAKPTSLVRYGEKWQRELNAEIKRCRRTQQSVDSKIQNKYRKKSVREALKRMYGGRCCYCEAQIGTVAYEHIEHRKPKAIDKFPELTFEWSNLHLACQKCNGAKKDQWHDSAPILDAVDDVISDHLTYKLSTMFVLRYPKSDRGDTTITHADLNREETDEGSIGGLPYVRAKIFLAAMDTIKDINSEFQRAGDCSAVRAAVRELQMQAKDDFGSVIQWAMDEWLDRGIVRD